MAKKTKAFKLPKKLLPLLPPKKEIDRLIANWRTALPVNLGNFFSYEDKQKKEIRRYDSYELDPRFIPFIEWLDRTDDNIKRIDLVLGRDGTDKTPELNDQVFEPILKLTLNKAVSRKKVYYFLFNKIEASFNFMAASRHASFSENDDPLEQISPKVAELFILNWQSLSDVELANAFEGLAPDSIKMEQKGGEADEVLYGHQKNQRVNQYIYSEMESRAMIDNLKRLTSPSLSLHLGSGLKVPNLHPFSFRPIIKLEETATKRIAANGNGGGSSYYDMSKPCPPLCPPDN